MKIKYINDIYQTVDFLNILLAMKLNKKWDFDELYKYFIGYQGNDYSIEVINYENDLMDVDIGAMTFTFYRSDDNTVRLNEHATYYTYNTNSSIDCDSIDVEL